MIQVLKSLQWGTVASAEKGDTAEIAQQPAVDANDRRIPVEESVNVGR